MGAKRTSYRNPFFSAFIFALLYFAIANYLYYFFHGELPFVNFNFFNWMESFLGTVAMGFLVLPVEFVRNIIGKWKAKSRQ